MKPSAPSKRRESSAAEERAALRPLDVLLIAIPIAIALTLMMCSGARRAKELMPWPDGLEYAAAGINLASGRGAVLHFGGYSYPSRYTQGYPLMVAAFWRLAGGDVGRLEILSIALGLLAIAAIYWLTLSLFGRSSALTASVILATSPIFLTYSTLVLSDVPTLTVTILAAIALMEATFAEQRASPRIAVIVSWWALFGLLAGFTVSIRPTNATLLAGVALALFAAPPTGLARSGAIAAALAFALGFVLMPLWQMRENLVHLGSAFASGYVFWVPEVYGSISKTFNAAFLAGPTMPRNPYGNLLVYALTLGGLDGLLTNPGAPLFYLYPFAAAVLAAIGIVSALGLTPNPAARRVVAFGLGFGAALLAVYLFYFFTDAAFILPACFILFVASGYGATIANRSLARAWRMRRKSIGEVAVISGVLALDLMLAAPILAESSHRFAATPRESQVVPALRALNNIIEPRAVVVSNMSLQFLELYLGRGRRFVGLHSFEADGDFSDYHLARLYARRAAGWNGPLPPVLFSSQMNVAAIDKIASDTRAGVPVYLLLTPPQSPTYRETIAHELDEIGTRFDLAKAGGGPLLLFRLKSR